MLHNFRTTTMLKDNYTLLCIISKTIQLFILKK